MVVPIIIGVAVASGLGGLLFGKRLEGTIDETGDLVRNISILFVIILVAFFFIKFRKMR